MQKVQKKKQRDTCNAKILDTVWKNTLSTMAGTMWGVRDIASFFINESFEGTDYGRGIGFF